MTDVLGVNVSASSYGEVVQKCSEWASNSESRAVLFVSTHGIMEAQDDPGFRTALNTADLANPEGMPVVWALRAFGAPHASRIYGPDTTLALLSSAEQAGIPIGFYGADDATLAM